MTSADARDQLIERVAKRRETSDRVLEAMRSVPRHEFVPDATIERAYADRPLPIGNGQTISAPYMVATMTDLLELETGDRVLEIGTGCGYHAAVTAEMIGESGQVYGVEYVAELAESARDRLGRLGYDDVVDIRVGDGHEGWPEHAPYDAAYLTCAAKTEVPDAIIDQTREGGRIVAPVGRRAHQELVRLTVTSEGIDRETHGSVRFVPMAEES
ncbi:protein-L-isoaspartate O-methyltransferase [Halopenitus sp. H-Gu1]|uniref:protein-L-isoaspartate O-methyltransferase n=1 Tax=Halopenitus sp. H-Gu1 TaxID=3242697 RepID=UPI00359DED54